MTVLRRFYKWLFFHPEVDAFDRTMLAALAKERPDLVEDYKKRFIKP